MISNDSRHRYGSHSAMILKIVFIKEANRIPQLWVKFQDLYLGRSLLFLKNDNVI